ncbi:MAG: hypothetical protein AAF721_28750 [Myxococcota bacterium]
MLVPTLAWGGDHHRVPTVDLSGATQITAAPPTTTRSLSDLDALRTDGEPYDPALKGRVVRPDADTAGLGLGDPDAVFAVEDIPGNEYPRKVTLYMNFVGADLKSGADNSAEDRSTLAKQGPYPPFTGGEQVAIAAAQEMANDVSQFGVRVVYDPANRPPPILPYTMAMIGGTWQDTNLEDSAAGVAPGADCGALGQRHVVYTFASGGWSATAVANVTAQEAGHAWGLDHSLNCGSVMSYCGTGNGNFSSSCDPLCEAGCQSPAGCRLFHEQFCGEGSDRQNEAEELAFLFGTNEPDLEPPFVEIQSPVEGQEVEAGGDVDLRAVVDDNYGGYGWSVAITRDGETLFDEVAFDRLVDDDYRAALNLVGLEPGDYTVSVTVMDHGDNQTTDTVAFVVRGAAADDGEDDGADDGGDTGGADDGVGPDDDGGSGDGTGVATGGASGGMVAGVEDRGGCSVLAGRPGLPAGLLLLLPVAWMRRRRA